MRKLLLILIALCFAFTVEAKTNTTTNNVTSIEPTTIGMSIPSFLSEKRDMDIVITSISTMPIVIIIEGIGQEEFTYGPYDLPANSAINVGIYEDEDAVITVTSTPANAPFTYCINM